MHDVLNSPFFDIQTRQNFFNERIFTKTRDNFPLLFHPQPHENAMERVWSTFLYRKNNNLTAKIETSFLKKLINKPFNTHDISKKSKPKSNLYNSFPFSRLSH